ALWQHALLDQTADEHLHFWTDTLRDAPDETPLPTDRPRPTTPSGTGGAVDLALDPENVAALRGVASDEQASMLMVLHSAVAALLHRLGGGGDLVVGTPVAGRDDTVLSELIGLFVNTVVLRTDVSGNPTFTELLTRVRTADLAAFAHADLPFDRIVETLNPPRVPGRNPLFNVFIAHHRDTDDDTTLFGLPVRWHEHTATTAMFDLGLTLTEHAGDAATLTVEYSADLFDRETVHTLARRLVSLLTQIARDRMIRVGDLEIVTASERAALAARNDTAHPVPRTSLAALVSAQAARTPHAVALSYEGVEMTYRELEAWSDRFAARLRDQGAAPGAVV
ncbi:condensation domain-containing protein, partial [Mycolicibacterium obuense]